MIGPESPVSPEMLQLPPEFVKSNFRVTLPLHDDGYGGICYDGLGVCHDDGGCTVDTNIRTGAVMLHVLMIDVHDFEFDCKYLFTI